MASTDNTIKYIATKSKRETDAKWHKKIQEMLRSYETIYRTQSDLGSNKVAIALSEFIIKDLKALLPVDMKEE